MIFVYILSWVFSNVPCSVYVVAIISLILVGEMLIVFLCLEVQERTPRHF